MIKIEFKEAQNTSIGLCKFVIVDRSFLDIMRKVVKNVYTPYPDVRAVIHYIPTQDPMLDRSHILSLLNRSEQEDKLLQEQYKNV